jgi:A-factor type gamma-butyrolactone 1'-reductase (1S-forming)
VALHYLVVGGTRGIGRASVEQLARAGGKVLFCGRDTAAGEALAASVPDSVFMPADITRQDDVDRLFDAVTAHFPRLDGAFNAAGVIGRDSVHRGVRFHESNDENFDRVFEVNVKGIWRCLRHELRIMAAQGHGAVVNCSSVAGLRAADSLSAAYTASKHALLGLTRALAVEYAPAGVRINAIAPGVIDTDMLGGMRDALLHDLRRKNAGARIGTAAEVAETVGFLLSDAASYVSGAVLTVDAGGLTGAL